ncbi:MAG: RNA polymerase factor sigma-54 [Pseudomonadota bacterium]
MKQTLSLKLGQQLTMTPQLQQAIRLLQLSTLDLQQEIQQTLESNPMLELDEDEPTPDGNELPEPEASEDYAEAGGDDFDGAQGDGDDFDSGGDDSVDIEPLNEGTPDAPEDAPLSAAADAEEAPIPDDLPVDTSWEDIYEPTGTSSSSAPADDDWSLEERNAAGETLKEHLLWQLNLTPMSDTDRLIATTIIDAVDPDGMLTLDFEELVASLNPESAATADETDEDIDEEAAEAREPGEEAAVAVADPDSANDERIELDECLAVLKRIQQFDPIGVCARNLAECLHLQLTALDEVTPWRAEAMSLVSEHLDVLAARDFNTLKRRTRLDETDLASVVALIQSLNPRPGSSIGGEAAEYIVPDVMVYKDRGRWQVELNGDATPKLKINELYASMVKRADTSADNVYLKDNLQEARWFLKSLQSRHETLLKVATKIVEHQRGFLEYGEEAMKPLVLADIAEAVDMHESTISRVTSRKYMHTPRGIFELKYFFSSHVSTASGGEVSSTAIRALIRKLTADENPRKPLSDNKIAAILAEQNIKVARRTVAKYRESMAIPPSNERKRLV